MTQHLLNYFNNNVSEVFNMNIQNEEQVEVPKTYKIQFKQLCVDGELTVSASSKEEAMRVAKELGIFDPTNSKSIALFETRLAQCDFSIHAIDTWECGFLSAKFVSVTDMSQESNRQRVF